MRFRFGAWTDRPGASARGRTSWGQVTSETFEARGEGSLQAAAKARLPEFLRRYPEVQDLVIYVLAPGGNWLISGFIEAAEAREIPGYTRFSVPQWYTTAARRLAGGPIDPLEE